MASLRIHVDQENRVPELRQKQANTTMAAQQKRPVLGVIDNKKANKFTAKGKQPLKALNGRENENKSKKIERKTNVVPPVAQFQAFSVYEDDEVKACIDKKLMQMHKNREDKLKEPEIIVEAIPEPAPDSPMSIEKSINLSNVENCAQSDRDVFFEIEEYRTDIFGYLKEHELKHRPKPGYIVKQPDVTENMRAILVDWLVEVVEEYKLHTETLYLAVNYIDRFLSYMSVVRAKLQLVGTAAMFIAAKYEEIMPPDVGEFVYITDDTYDKHQVIRMEHLILRVLSFDVSIPTPLVFINAMCVMAEVSEKAKFLAMYLSELALLEVEQYLQYLPSMMAVSAITLAMHTLGEDLEEWTLQLEIKTGYAFSQLRNCVLFLHEIFEKAPTNPQHAIQDKYKSGKYLKVSKLTPKSNMIRF